MAQELVRLGFRSDRVFVLKGGWDEWLKAGFPVEDK
ncbi:MAG: rhodanese-like domain-containing protein [Nitrospirota bacterium]